MALFVKHLPLLKAVVSIKDKRLQRKLLRVLCKNSSFKNCICEIAHNLVKQNINIPAEKKKALNRHASAIKGVLKKKRFSQSGGFLNIAVPLLVSQLGHLIQSRI